MSGRLKNIFVPFISVIIFLIICFTFDRDLFRYPLITHGKGLKREKAAILDTIRTYNAILTDIYVSGGIPALLNEFPATKAIRHGLFRDIGFIRDSNKVIVYDLAAMTPVEIRITSHKTAEAVVFEEWNYIYQRRDDRRPVTRIKGMGQGFRYRLIRKGNQWIVSAWDPVDVEEPEKKEEFLF